MKNLLKSIISYRVLLVLLCGLMLLNGCSDSPSSALKKRAKKVLKEVENYQFGQSRAWLQEFQDVMSQAQNLPDVKGSIEKMMVDVLESEASVEGKLIICKHIAFIGSEYCIPVLQKMMLDPSTQHMAIMALATLPDPGITQILADAIDKVDNSGKVAIANVLALKGDKEMLMALAQLVKEEDSAVKDAAAHALSVKGGNEAAEILKSEYIKSDAPFKWKMATYWLVSLSNEPIKAKLDASETILNSGPPTSLRYMAMKMKLDCLAAEEQVTALYDAFKDSDQEIKQAFVPLVRQLPEGADLGIFINSMDQFPASIKYQLMVAIADRYDLAIRPVLLDELKKSPADGSLMALKGLEKVSLSQDLNQLVSIAANGSVEEQELARSCIYWMDDENTDHVIVEIAGSSNSMAKAEFLKAIGYRKIVVGKKVIVENLQNPNATIRNAAIVAMGKIGTFEDLGSTFDLLIKNPDKADVDAIENTILAMALSTKEEGKNTEILSAKLASNPGNAASVVLITVLGQIGDDSSLSTLRDYIDVDNGDIQFAVLQAMSNWKDDQPITDLENILQKPIPQLNHSQAVVGMVMLIQNSKSLAGDQKVDKLSEVYRTSANTFDKQTIIKGISRIYSLKALDFVISQVNDPDVVQEAQEAVIRVAGDLRDGFHNEVKSKMEALVQNTKDEAFKGKINTLIKSMEL